MVQIRLQVGPFIRTISPGSRKVSIPFRNPLLDRQRFYPFRPYLRVLGVNLVRCRQRLARNRKLRIQVFHSRKQEQSSRVARVQALRCYRGLCSFPRLALPQFHFTAQRHQRRRLRRLRVRLQRIRCLLHLELAQERVNQADGRILVACILPQRRFVKPSRLGKIASQKRCVRICRRWMMYNLAALRNR